MVKPWVINKHIQDMYTRVRNGKPPLELPLTISETDGPLCAPDKGQHSIRFLHTRLQNFVQCQQYMNYFTTHKGNNDL